MAADRGRRRALFLETETVSAALLFVSNRLDDLFVSTTSETAPETGSSGFRVGEIHWARVDRILDGGRTGRRSAFLRAVAGQSLFLADADGVMPGERLLVEVAREAEGSKAARANRRLTFSGPLLAHTPGAPGVNVSRKISDADTRSALTSAVSPFAERGGFVIRTRAATAPIEKVAEEAARLAAQACALLDSPGEPPRLARKAPGPAARGESAWGLALADLTTEPALARRALETLEQLGSPRVPLDAAGDGWMAVEQTEALVSVDVNTGAGAAALQTNLAVMNELPRQLRLRGLGGIVVIDLAPVADGDRKRLQKALSAAADPALDVAGFGPLGLLEATRRKDRPPLALAAPALLPALAAIAEQPSPAE